MIRTAIAVLFCIAAMPPAALIAFPWTFITRNANFLYKLGMSIARCGVWLAGVVTGGTERGVRRGGARRPLRSRRCCDCCRRSGWAMSRGFSGGASWPRTFTSGCARTGRSAPPLAGRPLPDHLAAGRIHRGDGGGLHVRHRPAGDEVAAARIEPHGGPSPGAGHASFGGGGLSAPVAVSVIATGSGQGSDSSSASRPAFGHFTAGTLFRVQLHPRGLLRPRPLASGLLGAARRRRRLAISVIRKLHTVGWI